MASVKPVMIHEDGTDCAHEGPARATVYDEGGARCGAGQRVTHIRYNGRVATVGEVAVAVRELDTAAADALGLFVDGLRSFAAGLGKWAEENGPALARLAEALRDAAASGAAQVEAPRPCHCLCGKAHSADKAVCDGEAVTSRRYMTELAGQVDVPLCAPCATAQGVPVPAPALSSSPRTTGNA